MGSIPNLSFYRVSTEPVIEFFKKFTIEVFYHFKNNFSYKYLFQVGKKKLLTSGFAVFGSLSTFFLFKRMGLFFGII
jgi:hypothetical protein